MVQTREIAYTDFFLVQADQQVAQAVAAVQRLDVTAVIVRRWQGEQLYHYLFLAEDFRHQLAHANDKQTLEIALDLHEHTSTPVVEAYQDAELAPDRCVITDDDRVIGFYDVEVEPSSVKQSDTRGDRSGPQGDQPAETPVVCALQTNFPEQVALGQTASLLVSLVTSITGARGIKAMPTIVSPNSPVNIVLKDLSGFELVGASEGSLMLTDDGESLELPFQLRAIAVGPGQICVVAHQNGKTLGRIILTPIVALANQTAANQRASLRQDMDIWPDLTLRILERKDPSRHTITLELQALDPSLDLMQYGPIDLRVDPQKYFQEFFKDIEGLSINTDNERRIAMHKLKINGARLFQELVPPELRMLLWSLRERIDSMQVISDEPWIPWELLRLVGEEDGRTVEGPALCEAFAMTRWFQGIRRQRALRLDRMAVVVPTYSNPNDQLRFAQQERDYMCSLATDHRKVTTLTARYLDVVEALSAGTYDCWHFSGHGHSGDQNPDGSAIMLEDSRLKAGELFGEVGNFGLARPLVFLNACQTGQEGLSLTGIGGWAKRFVDAGASGFVGSLWSVRDRAAAEFAKTFYGHLLAGQPIGQAVRKAREAIKPLNDTTWLAYTVFADPLATVKS